MKTIRNRRILSFILSMILLFMPMMSPVSMAVSNNEEIVAPIVTDIENTSISTTIDENDCENLEEVQGPITIPPSFDEKNISELQIGELENNKVVEDGVFVPEVPQNEVITTIEDVIEFGLQEPVDVREVITKNLDLKSFRTNDIQLTQLPDLFKYEEIAGGIKILGFLDEYDESKEHVVIPDSINGNPVIEIANYAFFQEGITKLVLGENIQIIGSYAFAGNDINSTTSEPLIFLIPLRK